MHRNLLYSQAEKITGSILQHAVTEKELLIDRNRNYFTELTASAHDSVYFSEPDYGDHLLCCSHWKASTQITSDQITTLRWDRNMLPVINSSYLSSLMCVG